MRGNGQKVKRPDPDWEEEPMDNEFSDVKGRE